MNGDFNDYDEDVLLESLPSHSSFVTSEQNREHRISGSASLLRSNGGKGVDSLLVGSPPPPPPPLHGALPVTPNNVKGSSSSSSSSSSPQKGLLPPTPTSTSTGSGGSGKSTPGARPFLRKGSRVEPSALAGIQKRQSASPITAPQDRDRDRDRSWDKGNVENIYTDSGMGMSRGRVGNGNVNGNGNGSGSGSEQHRQVSSASGSGFKFEPLEERERERQPQQAIKRPPSHAPSQSVGAGGDANEHELSATFDNDWKAVTTRHSTSQRELSEFELLEQELGGVDEIDPLAMTGGSDSGGGNGNGSGGSGGRQRQEDTHIHTAVYTGPGSGPGPSTLATGRAILDTAHARPSSQGQGQMRSRDSPMAAAIRPNIGAGSGGIADISVRGSGSAGRSNNSHSDGRDSREKDWDRNKERDMDLFQRDPRSSSASLYPDDFEAEAEAEEEQSDQRGRFRRGSRDYGDESVSWGAVTRPNPNPSLNYQGNSRGDSPSERPLSSERGGGASIVRVDPNSRSYSDTDTQSSPVYNEWARKSNNINTGNGNGNYYDSITNTPPASSNGGRGSGSGRTTVRSSSPSRGHGVHHEGGTIATLMDHTHSGSVINRPPAKRPSSGGPNKRTPSPAAAGYSSTGVRGSGGAPVRNQPSPSSSTHSPSEQQYLHSLAEKATALEQELGTYKTENAQLVKLRKQAESALHDSLQQKQEAIRWAAEQRSKVESECEELRAAATKDRRLAAKVARDARAEGTATSVRKEKQERAVLEATIEQLRGEVEATSKRAKLTEQRLQGMVREHAKTIESLHTSLNQRQTQSHALFLYLDKSGIRIPFSLRAAALGTDGGNGGVRAGAGAGVAMGVGTKGATQKLPLSFAHRDRTHAQEVEVQEDEHVPDNEDEEEYQQREFDDRRYEEENVRGQDEEEEEEEEEDGGSWGEITRAREAPRGQLSDALFRSQTSSQPKSKPQPQRETGGYDPSKYSLQHHQQQQQQGQGQTALKTTYSASPTTSMQGSVSLGRRTVAGGEGDEEEEGSSLGFGAGGGRQNSDSWQRSSRGSRGSRYSGEDDGEEEEISGTSGTSGSGRDNHSGPRRSTDAGLSNTFDVRQFAPTSTITSSHAHTQPQSQSGRREEQLPDGRRLVHYRNGTIKEIHPSGESLVQFANGDTKWSAADSTRVVYYYAEAKTRHTTHAAGLEVYEFPNGQLERHYPDGTKEIVFPDRTRKVVTSDGTQETHFPDGVKVRDFADGKREIIKADGTRSMVPIS